MKTLTVLGATGNIGSKVIAMLANQNVQVRAVARNAGKIAAPGKNVKFFDIDVSDGEALANVLKGSDVVFAMIPPNYGAVDFRGDQNLKGDAIARAIESSGVKKVINLSSLGADVEAGVGPILGLGDQERRLNRLSQVDMVHLRPAYFFENVFFGVDLIKTQKIFGTPIEANVKFPQIATADIAKKVVELLLNPNFSGKQVIELLGERHIDMTEVTKALGKAFGVAELPYIKFAYADAFQAMKQSGMPEDVARNFVDLYRSINEGVFNRKRTKENTTATSFEKFSETLRG